MQSMWLAALFLLALTDARQYQRDRMVSVSGVRDFVLPSIYTKVPTDAIDCGKYIRQVIEKPFIRPTAFDYAVSCLAFYLSRTPDLNNEFSDMTDLARYLSHALAKKHMKLFGASRLVVGDHQTPIRTTSVSYIANRLAVFEGKIESLPDPLKWTYGAWCLMSRFSPKASDKEPTPLLLRSEQCKDYFSTERLDKWVKMLQRKRPFPRLEYPHKWRIVPD